MVPTPVKWLAPLELIERQNIFSCHVHDIDISGLHLVLPHGSKVSCTHVHSIVSVEWSVPLALPSRDMNAADQFHEMSRYMCVCCQFGVWLLVAPWICHNPHVVCLIPSVPRSAALWALGDGNRSGFAPSGVWRRAGVMNSSRLSMLTSSLLQLGLGVITVLHPKPFKSGLLLSNEAMCEFR